MLHLERPQRDGRSPLWWLWPAVLAVGAALALWLGRSRSCIGTGTPGDPSAVCISQTSPGSVVVAVICLATAVLLALVGWRRR